MAYTNQSFYPAAMHTSSLGDSVQTIINSDGTTIKELVASSTNGVRIEAISITSTETSTAHDVAFYRNVGGTNYLIGTVSVAVNSGFTSGAISVDVLRSTNFGFLQYDSCGNKILTLLPGESLYVGANIAVTSGKTLTICATSENY